jgi:predicted N-formylglutamate amidohydrolase
MVKPDAGAPPQPGAGPQAVKASERTGKASERTGRDQPGRPGSPGGTDAFGPTGPIAPEIVNPGGAGPLLLVCEHASNVIPARYANLGISADVADSHAAWDPGACSVARAVSRRLDAPLIAAAVSRLVYDCNRPPEAPGAMPEKSEVFEIPGNAGLSEDRKRARVAEVYEPFRQGLAGLIAATGAAGGHPKVLVTVHSFTPVYFGKARAVQIGILHDSDSLMADAMLAIAGDFTDLDVQRNQPYGPEHGVTHTLIEHGLRNGIPNVMIEIRNDLLTSEDQQQAMAAMLAAWIGAACERISLSAVPVPAIGVQTTGKGS